MKDFTFYSLSKERDKFKINVLAFFLGHDLVAIIRGGLAHIGAVSFFTPEDGISIIERKRHKDGEITNLFTEKLSKTINGVVTVICGIHFQDLSCDEIEIIKSVCVALASDLDELLREPD